MLYDIVEFRENILASESGEAPIPQLQSIFEMLSRNTIPLDYTNFNSSATFKRNQNKTTYLSEKRKVFDASKILEFLKEWLDTCKLRPQTEFPGTQEDAAEFLLECIWNKIKDTNILSPFLQKSKERVNYTNGSGRPSRNMSGENEGYMLQLRVAEAKENEKLSKLIFDYLNEHNKDNTAMPRVNQWRRHIFIEKPLYLVTTIDRTSWEGVKTNKNINIEKSIPLEDVTYNLYSAVIHLGETTNSGHYIYLFRNKDDEWIIFNDSRISKESNIKHLIEKNAVIVVYKKANKDNLPIHYALPPLVQKPRAAPPKEKITADFLLGKEVSIKNKSGILSKYTIKNIEYQSSGKLLGIRVMKDGKLYPGADGNPYKMDGMYLIEDNYTPQQRSILELLTTYGEGDIERGKFQFTTAGASGGGKKRKTRRNKKTKRQTLRRK